MRRFLRDNGLGAAFLVIFLAALVGQALVGHADFNHQQLAHQDATMSLGRYVSSSAFWVDVMENWQSEYLQFTLFIFATIFLVQRGSTESKPLGQEGTESDEEQKVGRYADSASPRWAAAGDWRRILFSNSLLVVMTLIWLGSWGGQAAAGRIQYNAEQLDHHEAALSLWQYLGSADFWNRTLQNWQSEFLAVGSIVIFSIYLRQRGSPQSKPVGAAHAATAEEG